MVWLTKAKGGDTMTYDPAAPILGTPPITREQVEELVVDAAPVVAYPDRPWVTIAGVFGALLLGGLVFAALIKGQQGRNVGGVAPTREATNDTGLGAPIPDAPDIFAQQAALVPPISPIVPEANSDAAMANQPVSPPSWVSPPPPPPPTPAPMPQPARVIEYRPSQFPPSPQPVTPTPAPVVRPAADIGQRMRSPALIVDLSTPAAPTVPEGATQTPQASGGGDNDAFAARLAGAETTSARAGALRNPKFIVPQGAMISAVLETAINSDLPGFVRAVVSRDVTSFDGSRVLIPRGSRLVGQYRSEVAIGQSRAFVIWTRLLRPDGVSVQLASPGTDPLGRAGLDGRVDRHYLQRFGPSLLTTAISAAFSGSNRSNQLVIGTAQTAASSVSQGEAIKPTVTVAQGTAIQVFVARDLDFSTATRVAVCATSWTKSRARQQRSWWRVFICFP
jgi:type IV secretory pathway VirB10-like protein